MVSYIRRTSSIATYLNVDVRTNIFFIAIIIFMLCLGFTINTVTGLELKLCFEVFI